MRRLYRLYAFNFDADACYDDGSCIAVALGCTDSIAFNYDPFANTDDNSSCYIPGCRCYS